MARLKIKDAPLLTNVIGTEKIPTGSRGDFAITPDMLNQYFINKIPFVTQSQLASVKAELEAKITTVETTLSQSISALDSRFSDVESSMLGFTQDLALHIADQNNPHKVTKQQIGLGSVDNTSDINKPLSTATKTYIDTTITNSNKGYNLDYFVVGKAYPLHSEIMLTNGVVVKSTVPNNTNNPNENLNGWVMLNSASLISTSDGRTQQQINDFLLSKSKDNVNLDDFKTETNTDTDAYRLAFQYCLDNNISTLHVTRDTTLSERQYCYQSGLTVDFHDNVVTYTGQGQDNLRFSAFNIFGSIGTDQYPITVSQSGYQTTLTISDASSFTVGDDIFLRSSSLTTPLIYLGHMLKITNISGNTLTVDTIIHLALTTEDCFIVKATPVKDTQFINMKFTATNQTSRANGVTGVMFEYTFNCKASVSCFDLWFKAIRVGRSNAFQILGGLYEKPKATDGGEGYGSQFEYCVNSSATNMLAYNMRHCFDITASWNIHVSNSYDYYSVSSSFGTHKAYEYDVTYENCHSIGSREHGFHFGNASFLFGQTATKIKMKNCTVLRSRNIPVTFTTLGNWLTLEDCILDPLPSAGIYSAVLANNDVEFINVRCTAGISIIAKGTANAYTGGYCKFTNSSINSNVKVSRSLVVGDNAVVSINGGNINGTITPRSNCTILMQNCDWNTPSVTGWLDTIQDLTQTVELVNVNLQASHTATPNYTYDWKVKLLRLNSVKFNVPVSITNRHKMSNVETVITNSFGVVSLLLDGTNATRYVINSNILYSQGSTEIIGTNNSYPLTCPVDINDNTLLSPSSANSVVVLATSDLLIRRLSMQRNSGVGRLRVADTGVTKCIVAYNTCDGSHILPTHDGISKIVNSNI